MRLGASASHRGIHRLPTILAVSAAVLLPWIAYLALTLPPHVSARHWPLVWCGLDVAIASGLAATAWLAIRQDRRLVPMAAATATLLLCDAWFDVCTSPPGSALTWAVAEMGLEVAGAAACLALAAAGRRDVHDQRGQPEDAGRRDVPVGTR